MYKEFKIRLALYLSIPVLLGLMLFSTSTVIGFMDNPSSVEQKLRTITADEKKVLQHLFKLTQEIQIAAEEEKTIAKELETLHTEIGSFDEKIKEEENSYAKKQEGLNHVMKTYQKMGAGSFLEIIMDSDSLSDFLSRLNTLREFTRKTGELLEQLEESKNKLVLEKMNLNEKIELVQKKQQEANESINKKLELKKKQEDYLASLSEERDFYNSQLIVLQNAMDELKGFLTETTDKFSDIIEAGSLPQDILKITFSSSGISGVIEDNALNRAIEMQDDFPKMLFTIHPGETEIVFPDKNLILLGDFSIEDGHILRFIAVRGSILGMPLEDDYIKELLSNGEMTMDLNYLMQGNMIDSIETKEGYIELSIKLNLFR